MYNRIDLADGAIEMGDAAVVDSVFIAQIEDGLSVNHAHPRLVRRGGIGNPHQLLRLGLVVEHKKVVIALRLSD